MFTASPYYKKLLSEDYTYVGLSVSINKENDGSDLMRRVGAIEGIFTLIEDLPQFIRGFVSGDAALYYKMDHATQKNLTLLLPLAFLTLLFISWLFLKASFSVDCCYSNTFKFGDCSNHYCVIRPLYFIINITLFILVITVADAIHMLNYWERYSLAKSEHPIVTQLCHMVALFYYINYDRCWIYQKQVPLFH